MSNRDEMQRVLPAMLAHEGVWTGNYRTVDLDGKTVDLCDSRVECVFPETGRFHYLQRNRFEYADGRTLESEFGGILEGRRIFWDTETFSGFGWETLDDVVMLKLDRKDIANATFTEIIIMGADGNNRARTWHWFRDGELYQRTLCNEWRVSRS